MLPYFQRHFGNPSSVHGAGRQAKHGVEEARERIAEFLHCRPAEVLFTSGGTESNNLALTGVRDALRHKGSHIITTAIEHSSILEPLEALATEGATITKLSVNGEGRVNADELAAALRPDTVLVSISLANHEIGTIQPIAALSRLIRERGIYFHVDAVQAAGKLPLDVTSLGVDLLSLSAHKISGPKGVGALYLRKGTTLSPLLRGGPQEREKRAGTENVAAIVGFAVAATVAARELEMSVAHCRQLLQQLWDGIVQRVPEAFLNSPTHQRLPNTLNVGFSDATGEGLLMGLDLAGIAVSTGSACAAGSLEPSHVLLALGRSAEEAKGALRFSVGKETTAQEIDRVLEVLPLVVERVRRAGIKN